MAKKCRFAADEPTILSIGQDRRQRITRENVENYACDGET